MKKAPAEARACNSEVEFRLFGVHLHPLLGIDVTNLLDLLDQFCLLTMLRQREEEVKLRAPLKLDPGDAVVVNHRLDDVVVLDLPHGWDGGLCLILRGGSCDGLVGVAHRLLLCVVGRYSHSVTLTRPLAVPLDTNLLR